MIILLSILNLLDYVLTLLNRGDFEEANPIMNILINNTLALIIIKLVLVPLGVYVLWKFKERLYVKISVIVLCVVYTYAVVLGGMITIQIMK